MSGDAGVELPQRIEQRDFVPPAGSTVVTLVRHGQSAAAERGRPFELVDGQGNPPLSERGMRQAVATAAELVRMGPTAAVVTTLVRTRQTAEPFLSATGIEPTVDGDLREVHLGDWEGGRYRLEAAAGNPAVLEAYTSGTHDSIPGAERDTVLRERVERGYRRAVYASLGGHVVIFSHGGAINALLSVLTGAPPTTFAAPSNCSISQVVDLGDRVLLRSFNHASHLHGI